MPVAPSAPQGPGLGLRFWLPELGGVALALGGGALLVVAQLQYTQLVAPGATLDSAEYTPKINALLTERTAGVVLLGIGGAAMVTGVLIAALAPAEPTKVTVAPVLTPGFAGASLSGRF